MAEGAPLLRVYRLIPIEGSNPSLSAIHKTAYLGGFFMKVDSEGFEPSIIRLVRQSIGDALGAASAASIPRSPPYIKPPIWAVFF